MQVKYLVVTKTKTPAVQELVAVLDDPDIQRFTKIAQEVHGAFRRVFSCRIPGGNALDVSGRRRVGRSWLRHSKQSSGPSTTTCSRGPDVHDSLGLRLYTDDEPWGRLFVAFDPTNSHMEG